MIDNTIRKIQKQYPERTVTEIYDYDEGWLLVFAPEHPGQREFNAIFLVSKNKDTVRPFVPFEGGETYLTAVQRKPIYEVT